MEYDPFSAEFQADPFRVYRWMRDEAPVFHSEKWNWWELSRFEDVRAAATDPETFLSFEGIDIDDTAKEQSGPGFLPDIDNPRHDQIRRIVQPQLLPNRVAEREDAVRSVVRGLIDVWRDRGSVDLAQELAWPMPNEVFFDLLGLPSARAAAAPCTCTTTCRSATPCGCGAHATTSRWWRPRTTCSSPAGSGSPRSSR